MRIRTIGGDFRVTKGTQTSDAIVVDLARWTIFAVNFAARDVVAAPELVLAWSLPTAVLRIHVDVDMICIVLGVGMHGWL